MKLRKITAAALAVMMSVTSVIQTFSTYAAAQKTTESSAELSTDSLDIQATNSFGSILAKEISAEQTKQLANNGCNVFSIEMDGAQANVEFQTVDDCTLVVGVYDESGETLLATGSTEVLHDQTEAVVSIGIDAMPEYFYLKGYLIDPADLAPMCTVYENPNYTQKMQEFFSKTVDDFDAERVLNFDDDPTNNFAVYEESTILIPQNDEGYNVVASADDTACVYVIENADDSFLSLEAGDIFAYQYGENDLLITKIAEMEVDGTTVTITGGETTMDEVFKHVRIEVEQGMEDADITPADGAVVVDENGEVIAEPQSSEVLSNSQIKAGASATETAKVSLKKEFEKEIKGETNDHNQTVSSLKGSVKVSASFALSASLSFKLYVSSTQNYAELQLSYSSSITFSATGAAQLTVPIGTVGFAPVAGCIVEITPSFIVKLSGELSASGTWTGSVGLRADADSGKLENISKAPKFTLTAKAQGTFYFGLDLMPKISLINEKVLSMSMTGNVGVEIVAKMSGSLDSNMNTDVTKMDKLHACNACIDGDLNFKYSLSFKVGLFKNLLSAELKLLDKTHKIGDFYYSFDYDEFDFERCPHILYKVEIECINLQKRPIENASLTFSSPEQVMVQSTPYTCKPLEGALLSDADGKAEVFLGAGLTTITATKEYFEDRTSTVMLTTYSDGSMRLNFKKTNEHQIIMQPTKHTVGVNVTDDEGNPVLGAKIYTLGNGTTMGALTKYTDLNGYAALEVHNGTYDLDITKSGYQDVKQTITVSNADQELTVQLIPDPHVRVNVTDENGDPVPGAEVAITGDSDYTDVTNENGICKVMVDEGEYAMTVSAEGYESQECTFTFAGETVQVDVMLVAEGLKIVSSTVSLGSMHSAAITEDGSLYMWGENYIGQLGDGRSGGNNEYNEGIDSPTPIKIMDNVASVSLGNGHSAAITEDGSLYMWGWNGDGKLGAGITTNSFTPIKIMDNVVAVSLGDSHSAAITEEGSLYMWGSNYYGQICERTIASTSTPIKIMDNVASVSLGRAHSAAITKDGSLYMWGNNAIGQLGDGTTTASYTPIKIMDNVVAVSLGDSHSAAITEGGSLYMWGFNSKGQLGDGTTTNSVTPIKIMDNVVAVSLGDSHSAAITEEGSLYMWGHNWPGKLCDRTMIYSPTPIKIMDNVAAVSLGGDHSAAITKDGSLYMWGSNANGQLGDGTTTNSYTPIKIMDNVAIGGSTTSASLTSETLSAAAVSTAPLATSGTSGTASYTDLTSETLSAAAVSTAPLATSGTSGTASYTDLLPDTLYNFYVLRSDTAENPLSADNLLYLNQYVSTSDGTLDITYTPIEDVTDAVLLAVPAQRTISGASIVLDDLCYDGTAQTASPTLTLGGVTLTEGTDYTLSGDTTADAVGAYMLTITGTGDYAGELTVGYWMYCEHNYVDDVCTICNAGAEPDYVLGDLNEDGQINAVDAARILVAAASVGSGGESGLTEVQELAADVNGDGAFNAKDAAEVLCYAAAAGSGYEGTLEEFMNET